MNDQSKSAEPKNPRVQAALREYLERIDRGEPVDREEFLARHAPIADELRSFIAAEDEVRKLAGAETPLDRAQDSTKSMAGRGQETVGPQTFPKEAGGTGLTGQFGRYRIIRALGKGAMGTVYLAEDTHIERQIALKTPHFTEDPTGEQKERFFREARAAGNLRHPHICPIYDFGQIEGKHYISMAYIEGRPLSAFIQPDKPQTERQILILVRKLALALQDAHDHGIVHRDLKPANIMVDKKGEPIIMDFGLARQARRDDDIRLTQTGNIIGTPAFMSPEQVEGEPDKIGSATDQYSLGVILYELLTAQLPFRGSVIAVMGQILTKEPPRPSQLRPDLDSRVEAVCLKMMAKTPSERFASLKTVADELATILKSPASKTTSQAKSASSPAPSPASDRMRADVGASQVLKSLEPTAVTESDLASLEELARKCYSRRDFEQVIQVIERIPEERRTGGLQALLEKSRGKADEISFLICEIDEAVRLNDRSTALRKAEGLLAIKPGHHQALKVQEDFAGYGEGGAARIGVLRQFTQPLNEGGWIPWSVLVFGLAAFGMMAGVITIYLRSGNAVVKIEINDPSVEVAVKGSTLAIKSPGQKVTVVPGDQELTITSAGLETTTKSFTIKKGETKAVTVSILDSKLVARFEDEIAPVTPAREEQTPAPLPPTFKNSLGMEFVLVPKGKSWLGGGGGRPGDKEVVIAQDFYLGKYEVTQEEWAQMTGLTPSGFSRTGAGKDMVTDIPDAELKRFPVEQVSWDDAQVFLGRLNKGEPEAGWVYRLPKAAEWEYACRGGPLSDKFESAYDFYFDKPTNQLLPEQANFDKRLKRSCKVGSYQPNRLGLYDMHGNVDEWCDDASKTADGATRRVHKGGAWTAGSGLGRAAEHFADPASDRGNNLGLRLARVPVGKVNKESPPPSAVDGFVPLFNRQDIKGWHKAGGTRANWRVNDGTLTWSGAPGYLTTDRSDFENFRLRVEGMLGEGADSGVVFRVQDNRSEFGYEAQIGGSLSWAKNTGSLFLFAGGPSELALAPKAVPTGRWFTMEILAEGNQFTIWVDGKQTVAFADKKKRYSRGAISLQGLGRNPAVSFRKVEIKELPPTKPEAAPAAAGPQPNVATTPAKISRRPFLVRGEWMIEGDELVQPTLATGWWRDLGPLIALGEETLSNYDLTFEIEKTGGRDAIGIRFHWLGPGDYRYFCLGGNGGMDFGYDRLGIWGREEGNWKWRNNASNRWYSLKLEVRGDTFRAYLDGELQYQQTDARFTHGRLCLYTDHTAARFRRIKVSDPQGKVLFEGLPELPRGSNTTIPKANNVASSPSLTAGETAAQSSQKQYAQRLKAAVISTNSLGMKLALIPPGEFAMGSHKSETERGGIEQQHRVRITSPFYLGVYEVTQSEFEQVMGRNPSYFSNSGGQAEAKTGVNTKRNPVENVTWYDAVEFCNKLSEKEGRRPYYRLADIQRERDGWIKNAKVYTEGGAGYRLPTEAQWEYACRAGTTTPFYFGMAANGAEFNCDGKLPYGTEEQGPARGRTVAVGGYGPNVFGLCDMHGNVNQWCWDLFDPAYYEHSPKSDPTGPSGGSLRVSRGGCWPDRPADCRSAARRGLAPGDLGGTGCHGIRVARGAGD